MSKLNLKYSLSNTILLTIAEERVSILLNEGWYRIPLMPKEISEAISRKGGIEQNL